jgi:signal transduction histidine kinase
MSLRARLALTAALASALAVALVAASLFFAVEGFLRGAEGDRLRAAAARVKVEVGWRLGPDGGEESWRLAAGAKLPPDVDRRLVAEGREVERSSDFPAAALDLPPGLHRLEGRPVYVQAYKTRDGRIALLALAAGAGELERPRAAYLRALAVTMPLTALLVALAGWFTAGRLLAPLRTLARAAGEVGASGDLERPLPGAGKPDELGRLAAALQSSFRALARTRARELEFTRAAAHDLRSPLAAIQGRVQATLARPRDAERYRHELEEVGADAARLGRLAGHLLLLARDPASLALVPASLATVVGEAVDRARELAPDTWIDFKAEGEAELLGDGLLLAQLADNLLANARRHAPGAPVAVSIERRGPTLEFRVADRGPGVPPEVLEELGRPFYRPDSARSGEGSGLGLAIARHVAELHGGRLRLESRPGEGFTAVAELPARHA